MDRFTLLSTNLSHTATSFSKQVPKKKEIPFTLPLTLCVPATRPGQQRKVSLLCASACCASAPDNSTFNAADLLSFKKCHASFLISFVVALSCLFSTCRAAFKVGSVSTGTGRAATTAAVCSCPPTSDILAWVAQQQTLQLKTLRQMLFPTCHLGTCACTHCQVQSIIPRGLLF